MDFKNTKNWFKGAADEIATKNTKNNPQNCKIHSTFKALPNSMTTHIKIQSSQAPSKI